MIKKMQPLTMNETKKILGKLEDSEKKEELESFIKKFSKSSAKADSLKKELTELGLIKLKQTHIIKIIDIMPEDASDLNKIFEDVSLDEDETNKILEIIKKYK